jgi:hypothetical protein
MPSWIRTEQEPGVGSDRSRETDLELLTELEGLEVVVDDGLAPGAEELESSGL